MAKWLSKRKRVLRRRRSTAKKPNNKVLAKVVKKVNVIDKVDDCFKYVSDMINVGTIVDQADTTEINSNATGFVRDFTNIDEDLDSTQSRLRQRIQLKKLFVRYQLRVSLNSSTLQIQRPSYKVRVMVIYQKTLPLNMNNRGITPGAQYPLIQNVLAVNSTCSNMDLLAPQSWVNRTGFRIMYDKIHTLYPQWRDTADPRVVPNHITPNAVLGTISLDLSKLPVTEYNSAADGQFAITKGRLFMACFSDNIAANTNPIIMEYNGIVNYDN